MKEITPTEFLGLVEALAKTFEEEESSLNELDSRIGDGECGTNLRKAFRNVSGKLLSMPSAEVNTLIEQLGAHLIASAGGTIGLLFGVGIRAAGKAVAGASPLKAEDIVKMGNAAIEAVKTRGRSQTGDKTFLDAMVPAVTAFSNGINNGKPSSKALQDAVRAAREGAETTRNMVARRGRASYLGRRSLGYIDPGASAFVLALESVERYLVGA